MVDFNKSCRLCLLEVQNHFNIFDGLNSLPSRIMTLANVEITEGDGLPTLICLTCYAKIEQYHDFKSQVEKSDGVLRDQLTNNNAVGSDELVNDKKDLVTLTTSERIYSLETTSLSKALASGIKAQHTKSTDMFIESSSIMGLAGSENLLDLKPMVPVALTPLPMDDAMLRGKLLHDNTLMPPEHDQVTERDRSSCFPFSHPASSTHEVGAYFKDREYRPNEDPLYVCEACDLCFYSFAELGNHRCDYVPGGFLCRTCSKSFKREDLLKRHELFEHSENVVHYRCEVCQMVFKLKENLKDHMNLHTGYKPYACNLCEANFFSYGELQSHVSKHGPVFFSCSECDKSFLQKDVLDRHLQDVHSQGIVESQAVVDSQEIVDSQEVVHSQEVADPNNDMFLCDICKKPFSTKETLKDHQNVHIGVKPHSCDICKKSFYTSRGLKNHLLMHDDKQFSCPTCHKSFARRDVLRNHLLIHIDQLIQDESPQIVEQAAPMSSPVYPKKKPTENKDKFVCDICENSFSNKDTLREHKNTHTGIKPYSCLLCTSSFFTQNGLKNHQLSHGEKLFSCSTCGKSFSRKDILRKHEQLHTREQSITGDKLDTLEKGFLLSREKEAKNKFYCDVCQKPFASKDSLKRHKNTHTGVKPFACDLCDKNFYTQNGLQAHKLTHGAKHFVCETCKKSFARKDVLRRHELGHVKETIQQDGVQDPLGQKKGTWNCPFCSRVFRSNYELNQHVTLHSDERPYCCHICGKTHRQLGNLKKHLMVHRGIRNSICEVCGKAFLDQEALRSHLITHSTEKPFHCNICGKMFGRASTLRVHKKIHAGIKAYLCNVCGVSFVRSSLLSEHRFVHTEERPHSCDECDKAFKSKKRLRGHMKKVHSKVVPGIRGRPLRLQVVRDWL